MSRTVIIGPPGTGKTATLVGRNTSAGVVPGIVMDTLRDGYQPSDIAFVSYSRAAVQEAAARVGDVTGIDPARFTAFRTLHSTWARALGGSNYMQAADWLRFKDRFGFNVSAHDESIEDGYKPGADETDGDRMLAAWDWCRAAMQPVDAAQGRLGRFITLGEFRTFVGRYEEFKQASRKLDHGDIIVQAQARGLLLDAPVILVDEAQDLSPLQVKTLEPSIERAERVWVVGDPDQAIYGFQGASPRWIMSLWDSPGWDKRVLDKSWRCPEPVRSAAARLISVCNSRVPTVYQPRAGDGSYGTDVDWKDAISEIDHHKSAFILARTGKFCGFAACYLFDSGIPYLAERGHGPNPLSRKAIMTTMDTLRALGRREPVSMQQVRDATELIPSDRGATQYGWLAHGAKTRIKNATATILYPSDYEGYGISGLVEQCGVDPWRVLEPKHPPRSDGRNELKWLRSAWDREGKWPDSRVTVTTWHGCKGREADLVIIDPSLSKPAADELKGPDADTEHRCAYVALTRARHTAIVVFPHQKAAAAYPFPR